MPRCNLPLEIIRSLKLICHDAFSKKPYRCVSILSSPLVFSHTAKEPCIFTKEPKVSGKEPHFSAREPWISRQIISRTYIGAYRLYHLNLHRCYHPQKSLKDDRIDEVHHFNWLYHLTNLHRCLKRCTSSILSSQGTSFQGKSYEGLFGGGV